MSAVIYGFSHHQKRKGKKSVLLAIRVEPTIRHLQNYTSCLPRGEKMCVGSCFADVNLQDLSLVILKSRLKTTKINITGIILVVLND